MRGWRIWVVVGAAVAASVSVAAIWIARAAAPMTPTGDMAIIERYVIEATRGRLLVGPYSRFQWHHPGPIYFYVLAPFYAASGGHTAALAACAMSINLLMIFLAAAIAWASGGAVSGALVATALTIYVLRADALVTSAWNPHIVVLPMAALVIAAAAACAGSAWCLPVAALVASFVAETHVGTLPVALVLGGLAVAAQAARRERGNSDRRVVAAATCCVLVLAWLPSLAEQLRHTPGNLTALWTFFVVSARSGQVFRTAFLDWAVMLAGVVRPDFSIADGGAMRASHSPLIQAWALGQMALLAGGAAVSVRSGRRFDAWMCLSLLAASLVALWSVTRIEGDVMGYEIVWISGLGALNIAAVASVAARWLPSRACAAAPALCAVVLVSSTLISFSRLSGVRERSFEPAPEAAAIRRSADALRGYLRQHDIERPFVDVDQNSWGLAAAVLLQLQKSGVSYAVADDWLPMFLDSARATGREPVAFSIAGAGRHEMIRGRDGVVPVLQSGPIFVDVYGFNTKR